MKRELTTAMRIKTQPQAAYEAFVVPESLRNFWFSGSSARWETGATVTLAYEEYGAGGFDIHIIEAAGPARIRFQWGEGKDVRTVDISFTKDGEDTIVKAVESGWRADAPELLDEMVASKEGWVYMLTCLKAWLEDGINTLRTGLVLAD